MYYTKSQRGFIERAKRVASLSSCRVKHGAVLVKGGRVIGIGVNVSRNHPSVVSNPEREASYHAEIMALRSVTGDTTGAVMYVARVNNHGQERMSKPCSVCQSALNDAGIKKVYYTIEGEIDL